MAGDRPRGEDRTLGVNCRTRGRSLRPVASAVLWEPCRLRFRLFTAVVQVVTTGRRRVLRLAPTGPGQMRSQAPSNGSSSCRIRADQTSSPPLREHQPSAGQWNPMPTRGDTRAPDLPSANHRKTGTATDHAGGPSRNFGSGGTAARAEGQCGAPRGRHAWWAHGPLRPEPVGADHSVACGADSHCAYPADADCCLFGGPAGPVPEKNVGKPGEDGFARGRSVSARGLAF